MKDSIPVTSCWRSQLTFGEMSPVDRCTTDSPKWLLTRSLILWDCLESEVLYSSSVDSSRKPGQILSGEKELVIAARKGAHSLRGVQLEGRRQMSAAEFLRGHAALLQRAG